ncbi:hypothetical protein [Streptomyces nigrescens]
MIRDDRFLISRKPYAVDLSTVSGRQHERGDLIAFSGSADVLWFRRQKGVTRACVGTLMLFSHYLPAPLDLADPHAILAADLDGRYGGDCHGRWDGTGYWGAEVPEVQRQHLEILQPMLANYPAIPAGYSGWYTFANGVR